MALSLRNSGVEVLARKVSQRSGFNITDTIQRALEAMERQLDGTSESLLAELTAIAAACAALPDLDTRSADEILGYDSNGLPGNDY